MSTPAAEPHPTALPGLVAGAILIGLAPIFVRLTDVGFTACAFWRAALSLPFLFALMRAFPSAAAKDTGRTGLGMLLLAGLFFGSDLAVWHQSIRFTSVANATLMANLAPVFVTLFAYLIFRERVRAAFLAGLVLALGGAAVLVSNSLNLGRGSVLGDLCGMAAAVFYAAYILGVSRARSRYSALEVMFWTTLATAAMLLPIALLAGDAMWPQSLHGWLVLLGLALLSHVAGQGLIAWALAHLPATFSAVGLLVQPIAAAVFAWLLLAEPFGARQAIGGAVILAGIVTCRLAMPAKVR
ncbi:MAG TPA: DMT family transporter [Solimonas sp.]|nr:DMT family transporter [Solimonas sp.]